MRSPARWISLVLGLWLVVAPLVLGYDDVAARRVDTFTGVAIAAFGLAAMGWSPLRFANALAGLWLVVAPFLLGYGTSFGAATINAVVVGALVVGAALGTSAETASAPVAPRLAST